MGPYGPLWAPMGRSSEAAGASPKAVMMPSGSTTSAALKP
jgi:hypothetical protein